MAELTLCFLQESAYLSSVLKIFEQSFTNRQQTIWYMRNRGLIKDIDSFLWTHSQLGFIPHSTDLDPLPELQPLLLSDTPIKYSSSHPQVFISKYFSHLATKGPEHERLTQIEDPLAIDLNALAPAFSKIIIAFSKDKEYEDLITRDVIVSHYTHHKGTLFSKILLSHQDQNNKWLAEVI